MKIGEDTRTRVESWKNLEENPWKMSILEYLGEFQWFWVVLEGRKQEERVWILGRISRFWQIRPLVINWVLSQF